MECMAMLVAIDPTVKGLPTVKDLKGQHTLVDQQAIVLEGIATVVALDGAIMEKEVHEAVTTRIEITTKMVMRSEKRRKQYTVLMTEITCTALLRYEINLIVDLLSK